MSSGQMYGNHYGNRHNGWSGSHHHGPDEDTSTERDYRSTDPSPSRMRHMSGMADHNMRHNGSVHTLSDPVPILPYWSAKRHLTCGNPTPPPPWAHKMAPWRSTSKLKTANAALVLCLNIDVDPPDVVKTNPCAVLECWVDPHTLPAQKALDIIGTNLAHQFEGLSPKITFKPLLDPAYDDLRKYCHSLRKTAKEDAILFYYNGHGVPKPTPSGEMWCFNKEYTQYIPVSLQEVQSWLLSPCVYIWDCSAAGHLVNNFLTFAKRRDNDATLNRGGYPEGTPPFSESIQLAACAADEQLPSCPELPADMFTSCLTSPIDIALRWFVMCRHLPDNITLDMVMQLPGDLKDRRTPLGELNWIFTAITDTIAWTTFPRDLFTRLYRSDLLVASLFRNFLLAERIMKSYHCTPHTYPPLPATNTHPLWASWDLAVDTCLRQLPELLKYMKPGSIPEGSLTSRRSTAARHPPTGPAEPPYTYIPSRFFSDQLTAFEVWISRGGSALTKRGPLSLPETNGDPSQNLESVGEGVSLLPSDVDAVNDHHLVPRKPPDQLPIVLQVLLSQPHRLRALILLSQFVDLGPWAVHLVLAIGIFPYISRLLQAASPDLRPVLIFIWARIFAVNPSCQVDLYGNQGYKYFANVLAERPDGGIPNSSEHKAMCAFVLSAIARDYLQGQNACWREHVFDACCDALDDGDYLLRQWSALCIAQIWDGNDEIKMYGVDCGTQDKLIALLNDDASEVRSAALYALGIFLGASGSQDLNKLGGGGSGTQLQLEERFHLRMEVAVVTGATLATKEDASPMVRKELLVLISCLVKEWRGYFIICAWIYWEEERGRMDPNHSRLQEDDPASQAVAEWLDDFGDDDAFREESRVYLSSFFTIFAVLLELSVDPYQEVAANAQTIVDYIVALLLESPFSGLQSTTLHDPPPHIVKGSTRGAQTRAPSLSSERNQQTPLSPYTSPYSQPSTPPPSAPSQRSSPHPSPRSTAEVEHQPSNYSPSDVIKALIEEDTERLKARRRTASHHRHHHHGAVPGGGMSSPASSTFSMDSSIIMGIGTGLGIRDALPLKSRFYDWCCDYFKEPQMRQPETDEPGSVEYNYQIWRQQRNERVLVTTRQQAEIAPNRRWDRPVSTIQITGLPVNLAFHSFDPHLIIANEHDTITVWDWMQRKRLSQFFNGNPQGTTITSLRLINQDVGGIILAASDWKQTGGSLLVGGDSRVIRVWDAHTESQVMDMDTNSESPVTAIVSDEASTSTFLASFADGVIKVFDRRMDEEDAVNVKWHPLLSGHFLSGSVDGEVKLWDIRGGEQALQTWDVHPHGLSAFDVHDHTNVFVALIISHTICHPTLRRPPQATALPRFSQGSQVQAGLQGSQFEMVRAHTKQTPDDKEKSHKKKSSSKKKSETGQWPCKINGCNKVFAREADLKRHQRTTKLHSMPGFHNGVIIPPVEQDNVKNGDDGDGESSGSKSPSPDSPKRSGGEASSSKSVSRSTQPVSSGSGNYYRQHTMTTYPPRPGMIMEQHYPPSIGPPTSAARLHQATWHHPPPWPEGPPPPGMYPMGPPVPGYYHSPYYRTPPGMIPYPPPHHYPPPVHMSPEFAHHSHMVNGMPYPQPYPPEERPASADGRESEGEEEASSQGSPPAIDPSLDGHTEALHPSAAEAAKGDKPPDGPSPEALAAIEVALATMRARNEDMEDDVSGGDSAAQIDNEEAPSQEGGGGEEDGGQNIPPVGAVDEDKSDADAEMDVDRSAEASSGSAEAAREQSTDEIVTEDGVTMLNPGIASIAPTLVNLQPSSFT
ncbi:hypothetical protein POSPLADRAFT_1128660 [Postia placenta MAD-698-R-SB12]|uniref:C2H2-type domain-containing protein n=1 Tax=Postia placenta MAD-698-R-SB12 TaxID=670580 RepID=A0A1X6NEF1_9APHY|nr:hypothetical protein POSPLADRAFT_1128660 [Postia placenta MAD-698-R-SB12]OSX66816.1 hypothetical protein POSPLADRAFT_1128660 [Postia placenta MAD-698-R-SB12]